nr:hypothetical protein Iba_chr02dCG4750 [Ipomoea batatas]
MAIADLLSQKIVAGLRYESITEEYTEASDRSTDLDPELSLRNGSPCVPQQDVDQWENRRIGSTVVPQRRCRASLRLGTIGVLTGFELMNPASFKMSKAYLRWQRFRPSLFNCPRFSESDIGWTLASISQDVGIFGRDGPGNSFI